MQTKWRKEGSVVRNNWTRPKDCVKKINRQENQDFLPISYFDFVFYGLCILIYV